MTPSTTKSPEISDQVQEWFESFINSMEVDRLTLQTNTATKEQREVYTDLANGSLDSLAGKVRTETSQFFIKKIVSAYLIELKNKSIHTQKLAFDLSDSKVLVWAEIEDDNEEMEDSLLLAEAKINAVISPYRFNISTTITESNDCIPVPSHYFPLGKK